MTRNERRIGVVLTLVAFTITVRAQFDLGGSLGVYFYGIEPRDAQDQGYASFDKPNDEPAFTASLFYREKRSAHTDLGLELQYTMKEFDARYGYGGANSSEGKDVHVTLHLLHFGITPEVRMTYSGNTVVRFGPQIGLLISGRMSGYGWTNDVYSQTQTSYDGVRATDFKGDLRAFFGMGFRLPTGKACGLTIDPYVSASINSLLKSEPGSKGTEYGIKFGVARRSAREALTAIIDRKAPSPARGSW